MVMVEMPEMQPIGLLKKESGLTKEEASQWTFKKPYLVAFLGQYITQMQLRQPKNVVEAT